MLTATEIDSVVVHVVDRMDPREVIVFGSYAKGMATRDSDLDLFVVKQTHLPMTHRRRTLPRLRAAGLVPVDIHVYTPEEVEEYRKDPLHFVTSVLRSGRTAYRKEAVAAHRGIGRSAGFEGAR